MNKKLLLSLGTITTLVAPVAAVVACGSSNDNKDVKLVSQEEANKLFDAEGALNHFKNDVESLGSPMVVNKAKVAIATIYKFSPFTGQKAIVLSGEGALGILIAIRDAKNVDFEITKHQLEFVKAVLTTSSETQEHLVEAVSNAKLPLKTPANKVLHLSLNSSGDIIVEAVEAQN